MEASNAHYVLGTQALVIFSESAGRKAPQETGTAMVALGSHRCP